MLHVLPNDPLFQELQPLQIAWLVENLSMDADQEIAAMKKHSNKHSQTTSMTSDTIDEQIARHRMEQNAKRD